MNTKFTKTQDSELNGLLRHILTAAGGALVARGSLAESARREWSGVGRDSLQPASGGALVHSTRCHHLLDVHQDRQVTDAGVRELKKALPQSHNVN